MHKVAQAIEPIVSKPIGHRERGGIEKGEPSRTGQKSGGNFRVVAKTFRPGPYQLRDQIPYVGGLGVSGAEA